MHIGVCVKIIPDPSIIVLNRNRQLDPDDEVYMINPCDLAAVDTALGFMENGSVDLVTVVSVAPPEADEILRRCLAMGVTQVIRLWDQAYAGFYNDATGTTLAHMLRHLAVDLIFCGHMASDDEMGYTGYQIARVFSLPFIQKAVHVQAPQNGRILVTVKLDGGNREVIEADLPAVIGLDDRLVEPRDAKLTARINAFRARIETLDLKTIGLPVEKIRAKINRVGLSPHRSYAGKVFKPDSLLPAPERLKQIMNGGISEKKETLVEGSAEELSQKFVQYIRRNIFLNDALNVS